MRRGGMNRNLQNGIPWFLMLFCMMLIQCLAATSLSFAQSVPGDTEYSEIKDKEDLPPETQGYALDWQELSGNMVFAAQFDANYLRSKSDDSSLSGGSLSGILTPGYKVNDRTLFMLMYDGNYYKRQDFYSDQVGPRRRTEFQSHTITPMLRMNFGPNDRYSITPSIFHTRTYNKDVEGGGWDDGLYNYRDTGAGLDFRMAGLDYGSENGTFNAGIQYYNRDYPNYDSLLDLATGNAIEKDERDYKGTLLRVGYNWLNRTGISLGTSYYLLYKNLDDKKVVASNGVLTGEEQEDYLNSLDFRVWYVPDVMPALRIGLDINGTMNKSNQNYYDGMGTVLLEDDVFMADFYDYDSYRFRPNISYTFAAVPLTASAAYSYQKTKYDSRRAQDASGAYKNDKQEETQEDITIGLRYFLSGGWSLYARFQYTEVESNNDDQSVYQYNHTVKNYFAGVTFIY